MSLISSAARVVGADGGYAFGDEFLHQQRSVRVQRRHSHIEQECVGPLYRHVHDLSFPRNHAGEK
jgi:hypothetical protein